MVIVPSSVRRGVRYLLSSLKTTTDEIDIHFVTAQEISRVHEELFNDPTVTDCITIPCDAPEEIGEDGKHCLGECFICPLAAIRYAAENYPGEEYKEVTRYVIHCLLHLVGYTDDTHEERQRMRCQEDLFLESLIQCSWLVSGK